MYSVRWGDVTQQSSEARCNDVIQQSSKAVFSMSQINKICSGSLEEAIDPLIPIVHNVKKYAADALQLAKIRIYLIELYPGLTLDKIAAIFLYTLEAPNRQDSLYYILNEHLRSENLESVRPFFKFIKLLMDGLDNIPTFTGTVWRALQDVDAKAVFIKNQEVVFNGFTSCSLDVSIVGKRNDWLGDEAGTLLSIEVSRGYKIRSFSKFTTENEVLLPAGSRFLVKDIVTIFGTSLVIVQLVQTN